MPKNGDVLGPQFSGLTGVKLLYAQDVSTDGVWSKIEAAVRGTLEIDTLETDGKVAIYVSNAEESPAITDDRAGKLVEIQGDGTVTIAGTFAGLWKVGSAGSVFLLLTPVLPVRFIRCDKVQGAVPTKTNVNFWGTNV